MTAIRSPYGITRSIEQQIHDTLQRIEKLLEALVAQGAPEVPVVLEAPVESPKAPQKPKGVKAK